MKKLFLVLLLLQFTVIFGCVMNGIEPGDMVTKTYEVSEFTKLDVSHTFHVTVKVGEKASLKITAGENIHQIIRAKVSGSTLALSLTESTNNTGDIKAEVTVENLEELEASGASNVDVHGVNSDNFVLDVSGATQFDATNFNSGKLSVDMSGASTGDMEGEVKTLIIDISGATSFDAKGLSAEDVVADISGASNAKVTVSKSLKVDASGASNLNYYGNPPDVSVDESGASNVNSK